MLNYPPDFVEEQDRRRQKIQSEWYQERERFLKTRFNHKIDEGFVEGLLTRDDDVVPVREDIQSQDEEMRSYGLEKEQLFVDPFKEISFGFVDRVFELFYEIHPINALGQDDEKYLREETQVRILKSMGFDIPEETFRDLNDWCRGYWLMDLQQDFEKLLRDKHPELHKYWEFSQWVYTFSKIPGAE